MLQVSQPALTGCDSAASKENSNAKKQTDKKLLLLILKESSGVPFQVISKRREQIRKIKDKSKARKRIRVRERMNPEVLSSSILQVPLPVHHQ